MHPAIGQNAWQYIRVIQLCNARKKLSDTNGAFTKIRILLIALAIATEEWPATGDSVLKLEIQPTANKIPGS